jgi:hypothetical protein
VGGAAAVGPGGVALRPPPARGAPAPRPV